jgi:hypothetical protein
VGDRGPLTRKVMQYQDLMKQSVPTARAAQNWAPLAEFVSVDHFERIGTFLEFHDWHQYTEMLSQWARSIDTFETMVKRISELPDLVYFEIEERHVRNQRAHIVNSMTVFEFDADAASPSTCNSPGDGTAGALI